MKKVLGDLEIDYPDNSIIKSINVDSNKVDLKMTSFGTDKINVIATYDKNNNKSVIVTPIEIQRPELKMFTWNFLINKVEKQVDETLGDCIGYFSGSTSELDQEHYSCEFLDGKKNISKIFLYEHKKMKRIVLRIIFDKDLGELKKNCSSAAITSTTITPISGSYLNTLIYNVDNNTIDILMSSSIQWSKCLALEGTSGCGIGFYVFSGFNELLMKFKIKNLSSSISTEKVMFEENQYDKYAIELVEPKSSDPGDGSTWIEYLHKDKDDYSIYMIILDSAYAKSLTEFSKLPEGLVDKTKHDYKTCIGLNLDSVFDNFQDIAFGAPGSILLKINDDLELYNIVGRYNQVILTDDSEGALNLDNINQPELTPFLNLTDDSVISVYGFMRQEMYRITFKNIEDYNSKIDILSKNLNGELRYCIIALEDYSPSYDSELKNFPEDMKSAPYAIMNSGNLQEKVSVKFTGCKELTYIPPSLYDYIDMSDLTDMFNGCEKLSDISGFKFGTEIKDCTNMFKGCIGLKNLPEDFLHFKTSQLERAKFYNMFANSGLTEDNLPKIQITLDQEIGTASLTGIFNGINLQDLPSDLITVKSSIDTTGTLYIGGPISFDITQSTNKWIKSELPENITLGIGSGFYGCDKLTTVKRFTDHPIMFLGDSFFSGCENLVNLDSNMITLSNNQSEASLSSTFLDVRN